MGCRQSSLPPSTEEDSIRPIEGVGATERLRSRSDRIRQQYRQQSNSEDNRELTNRSVDGAANPTRATSNNAPPKLDASGHLMPEEVVRRTSSSIFTESMALGTTEHPIRLTYAHWTQRGYYPDDPNKENQDQYAVHYPFGSTSSDAMLAVYDGHGVHGGACAKFAKHQLNRNFEKHVRQARVKAYKPILHKSGSPSGKAFDPERWPMLSPEVYKACCRKAFLECNDAMHKNEALNDKLSGTTAITINFHGNHMIVCNVGDSRAILGHWVTDPDGEEEEKTEIEPQDHQSEGATEFANFPLRGGEMIAIPLSRDQTPYRRDERERVKNCGAAIMSIDQMEGKEELHENWGNMVLGGDCDVGGDPPRVWLTGKQYPGTAFTRSIGDHLAEPIGVSAEPEMLVRELTANDHVLVLASDGIFEFLTNQEVIDMCITSDSPLQACERLTKAAYEQWLAYENRSDDITVIVCFLKVDNPAPSKGIEGTTEDLIPLAKSVYGQKPSRTQRTRFKSEL